ncbi:hypothetical protein GGS21DRAFT_388994 [Xylaria nigripes]|nr:hypothetical protein GGS21DRAFT_388994 [Xylaria nigripes]
MNWTEGNLARHSRGKHRNALIARQKQHFAKVRHNLLSGRAKQGPAATTVPFLGLEPISESPARGISLRKHDDQSFTPLQSHNPGFERRYSTYLPNDGRASLPTDLDRRKKLLRKSDWAGLRLQRPLDISFPGQVYVTKRWARAARIPEKVSESSRHNVTAHVENRPRRLKRSSMKIHIGGQEIQPSLVTGSQHSTRPYTAEPHRSAYKSKQHHFSSGRGEHLLHYPSRHTDAVSSAIYPAIPASLGRLETPVNVVYSSSVIHEPAPRRSGDFRVLRWSPSISEDRGSSMRVEIERSTNVVSTSQESEQKRWKNWILYKNSSDVSTNSLSKGMDIPDICSEDSSSSALTLPSHLQPQLPIFHLLSEAQPSHKCVSPEHIITEDVTEKHGHFEDTQPRPENVDSMLPKNSTCRRNPDDLNDVWMRFTCGDENSVELRMDAIEEATHRVALELRPSDTSSSVEEGIEVTATCEAEVSSTNDEYEEDVTSPRPPSQSHAATHETTNPSAASSNNATTGSSDEVARNAALFVMPKFFVGKYVNTKRAKAARSSIIAFPNRSKGRGKKKQKVTMDGRTNIRNLPDFDGDPIEEIEGD